MPFTAAEIARHLQGTVIGDGTTVLTGFAAADHARVGDLTFAENESYFARAEATAASGILVSGQFVSPSKVLIRVSDARIAFARVLPLFFPEKVFPAGVHPTAVVADSAEVDASAHVGPHCVIGERVHLGARAILQSGISVDDDSRLGEDTHIFPNVTIYARSQIGRRVRIHAGAVIGSDGFGYAQDAGVHRKVPQVGRVIIGDDVEIGANVTVDRGALGPTMIGKGTKIDNLVQVGHNVVIGEHCLIIAQVGIAGSTRLGNYTILGGQVGLAGHLTVGDGVTVAAQSGVMHNLANGQRVLGTPAVPDKQAKRQLIAIQQLPELIRRVRGLERTLVKVATKLGMAEEAESAEES